MNNKASAGKLCSGLLCCLLTGVFACSHIEKNQSHRQVPDSNITRGKELAAFYCGSCHRLPDPSLLDAKHWEQGVLPAMGPRLGIFNNGQVEYPSFRNDPDVDTGYYPRYPVMQFTDWQYIIDYYTAVSPDTLPAQKRTDPVTANAGLFSVEKPPVKNNPATCMIKIDTAVVPALIVAADTAGKQVFRFNSQLTAIDSFRSVSPVVDADLQGNTMVTCNIGVMTPHNGKYGSAGYVSGSRSPLQADSGLLFSKLARPVQITRADLNNDGKPDFLVCEFGHLAGALTWMENLGDRQFRKRVLRAMPGAVKAYVQDANGDGLPDIWALFAQGDEGIFLFTNKGAGRFEQQEVLSFPPIYGSSYFELADFNGDGQPDILYTCGDNADYSPVLKPYHGVYIFINDGRNHFRQSYFFPMYGCFKAVARDFDGDGDLDIAAISFFADYAHHPEESFVYLENKGYFHFKPWSVPGTAAGRWLTMDAGDIDGDGRTDIVLGNFSVAPAQAADAFTKIWKAGPPFLVLKNRMKKY